MSHAPHRPLIPPHQVTIPTGHAWARLPWIGAAVAVVGLGALALLTRGEPRLLLPSWLLAFLFVLSIALGSLFFVLVAFATKAGWSVVVRRIAENAMATLPLLALLFVPIALGLEHLYPWAGPHEGDHLLEWKRPYLNVPFFVGRAVLYFAVWSGLALWYLRRSRAQDATGEHAITRRLQRAAGPGLLAFALTVTFAAVDWIMSLTPHWYSTIFGVYWFSGCLVAAFAFLAILSVALRRAGLMGGLLTGEHFHDLGKLLFAFTVFWAYIAFSQYFLIWYGNLPEETFWYARRMAGSWQTASVALAVGHFAIPFFFLLPRTTKRRTVPLVAGAVWMLAMHWLDLYWLVMPTFRPAGFSPSLADAAALVGLCGFFLAALGFMMRRHALLPIGDPRLPESLTFENV